MRDYIPVNKNNLPERFEIDLASDTFWMQFNYNDTSDFFSVDLYTGNNEPIILGEKLILNVPLWQDFADPRLPAPSLVVLDESEQTKRITFDNFMVTTFLYIDDIAPEEEV
jgi:hypothetical protein